MPHPPHIKIDDPPLNKTIQSNHQDALNEMIPLQNY